MANSIQESIMLFKDWHAKIIAQVPETIQYRTSLRFSVFSLVDAINPPSLRALMGLKYENFFSERNGQLLEEMRYKILSTWPPHPWRHHEVTHIGCPAPKSPSCKYSFGISEAWDNHYVKLDRELEKERDILVARQARIWSAFDCIREAKDNLCDLKVPGCQPKRLILARNELDKAIKLIRRKAKCKTFLADEETFKKKVFASVCLPAIDKFM